jgi:hypothetical protein
VSRATDRRPLRGPDRVVCRELPIGDRTRPGPCRVSRATDRRPLRGPDAVLATHSTDRRPLRGPDAVLATHSTDRRPLRGPDAVLATHSTDRRPLRGPDRVTCRELPIGERYAAGLCRDAPNRVVLSSVGRSAKSQTLKPACQSSPLCQSSSCSACRHTPEH